MEDKKTLRVCKKCNEILNIELFPLTKNNNKITYRHTCKKCDKLIRQKYFKEYHKRTYKSKSKKNI